MMFLRLLNPQGIAGLALSLGLALLLVVQKGDTRHWKKESSRFEQLYHGDQAAFAATVANYRAAAEAARAADQANVQRVAADQRSINERSDNAFESRLAAARARAAALAERLRVQSPAAARAGIGGDASVSGVPAASPGASEAAGEDRLPAPDALTATEQAIQLDELIRWVKAQTQVDPNARSSR